MAYELIDIYRQIPSVTRWFLTISGIIVVLGNFHVFDIYRLLNYWPYTLSSKEIWRPFTAFLVPKSIGGVFAILDLFVLYQSCLRVERIKFNYNVADFVFYLLFNALALLFVSFWFPEWYGITYMGDLVMAFVYTWAQEEPEADTSFFIISVKAKFLPFLYLAIPVLGGDVKGAVVECTGLVTAHMYLFFDSLWPAAGGPRLIHTPHLLTRLFPQTAGPPGSTPAYSVYRPQPRQAGSATTGSSTGASGGTGSIFKSRFQGRGHRLGS
ncbi:hypothetical protein TRVA0_018S01618 [Trichomonascus vanleenenianus]|uniref:uncharacterized protein n=1 Tax=Trichomonascus vanleenenianus TaxID=2268995 RepID=UPI003ECB08BF